MKILGLTKTTLLDYPEKTACILFIGGCNFRCPYCHNYELAELKTPEYDPEYITNFLKKRRGILEGVVISGGEPCMHPQLPGLLYQIKELGYSIKLDTNGSFPDMIAELLSQALIDYIAMDIKAPIYDKDSRLMSDLNFDNTAILRNTGINNPNIKNILRSIGIIKSSVLDYEFRTTVAKGLLSPYELVCIAKMIPWAKKYFIQSFAASEFVPDKSIFAYDEAELNQMLFDVRKILPNAELR